MKHVLVSLGLVTLLAGVGAGCGSASSAGEPAGEPAAEKDAQELVTQTIVYRAPDGEETTTVKQITRAEQRAEVEARNARRQAAGAAPQGGAEHVGAAAERAITVTACDGAALWLFDAVNDTGNELCLNGNWNDQTSLGNFCHDYGWVYNVFTNQWVYVCLHSWSAHVKSYYPGDKPGDLETTSPFCNEYFSDETQQGPTNASSCGQTANTLWFGYIG